MCGQHELEREVLESVVQLRSGQARPPESRERLGERLARHSLLVLVLTPPTQPVVLLGDVRKLEVEAEGAEDRGLALEVELPDGLPELRSSGRAAGRTCLAGQQSDSLFV